MGRGFCGVMGWFSLPGPVELSCLGCFDSIFGASVCVIDSCYQKWRRGKKSAGVKCPVSCLLFPKILEIALPSSSLPLDICFCTVTLISSELSQGQGKSK